MNRNQFSSGSRRDRYQGDSSRPSEQFSDTDNDYGDDNRSYRQMGERGSRRDYGQSDNDGYGASSRGGGWAGDRDRGAYDRHRDDREREDRQRSSYSEQGQGYSSGGYGRSRYAGSEGAGFGSFNANDFGGRDFSGSPRNYGPGSNPADSYGAYGGTSSGPGAYGASGYGGSDYGTGARSGGGGYGSSSRGGSDRDERGFLERAGDKVASWFGDDDDGRRRDAGHSGRGPANYKRSDERILEDACDRLTDDWGVDASNIQVTVQDGEVTLDGTVPSRQQKRRAEDCVDDLSGVKHVQNNLRVQQNSATTQGGGGQSTTNQGSSNQSLAESSYDRTDSTSGTLA